MTKAVGTLNVSPTSESHPTATRLEWGQWDLNLAGKWDSPIATLTKALLFVFYITYRALVILTGEHFQPLKFCCLFDTRNAEKL
jgi:hypothetical protein